MNKYLAAFDAVLTTKSCTVAKLVPFAGLGPHGDLFSACEKFLNSGLNPFKDQTAEMVLFLHKSPCFPTMIIMLCNPVPGT